ncbi:MAG: T9SS type A sorting domain-containing protein [Bacteroidetes bacterium]|nr:T9SS type A sorting domain-containing protein [Bacteroidota bacterium]
MKQQYFFRLTVLPFLIFLLSLLIPDTSAQTQDEIYTTEETTISGGAEFNIMLQEAIRTGNIDNFIYSGNFSPPTPNSLNTISTFDGFGFDDNSILNGSLFIPPDPSGVGGLDRVIAVVNTMIECRDTTGTLLWQDDLSDFFTSLTPTTFTFDPKVIYDQYENRFVVVDLEQFDAGANPDSGNISRIFLAVSKTSTPATATSADWYFHAINSEESIGGLDYWADYPGFAIDEEAVYVTANMFEHAPLSGGGATRLWIIDKGTAGGFYGGGATSVTGGWDFPGLTGGFAGTHQPAHVFGATGVATGVGTFLVKYDGLTLGGPGGTEAIQVIRVNDPLGTPSFTGPEFVSMGDIEDVGGPFGFPPLVDAPQSGSSTGIEVNDRRTLHAVWRNNSLWMTTTITPNSGSDIGQTTAHWVQLNTTTLGSTTLTDQGNVGGEDIASGTFTFFPSIAVNINEDVIIGFSASASTIFPGAYYAGRFVGDPAGTVNPSVVVRAGLDTYVRIFSERNRWGDYTGASVDPNDDKSFWVFNEYALTRGSGTPPDDGRWGTVYAHVPLSDLPVELTSFAATVDEADVTLSWSTATETNNQGFEIQRSKAENEYEKIGYVPGHGTTTEIQTYSYTDSKVASGNYTYRLKQIDYDGTIDYSDEIAVEVIAPLEFALEQNYPNPFNPSTIIKYSVLLQSKIKIALYDVIGNEVETLFEGVQEAGIHEINLTAGNLPSGVYFVSMTAQNFNKVIKITLMK